MSDIRISLDFRHSKTVRFANIQISDKCLKSRLKIRMMNTGHLIQTIKLCAEIWTSFVLISDVRFLDIYFIIKCYPFPNLFSNIKNRQLNLHFGCYFHKANESNGEVTTESTVEETSSTAMINRQQGESNCI